MTLVEGLRDLSATRGVRSTAIVTVDGFVVESLDHDPSLADAAARLAPALSASRRLLGMFEQGDVTMTTLEFERGLALVVPLRGDGSDDALLFVVLESVDDVGRVRMAVRRVVKGWTEAGEV